MLRYFKKKNKNVHSKRHCTILFYFLMNSQFLFCAVLLHLKLHKENS